MTDTGDLDRRTGTDVRGRESGTGHAADTPHRQPSDPSADASDIAPEGWRAHDPELLRDRHEAVLTDARSAVGKIAGALRDLETKGFLATGGNATADDNPAHVDRADRRR